MPSRLLWLVLVGMATGAAADPIDRQALVTRHNPRVTAVDPWTPLTVGNGRFAFTVDATGLQTFGTTYHAQGIPLETLARWGWHTETNPNGYRLEDAGVGLEGEEHDVKIFRPTRWYREDDIPGNAAPAFGEPLITA